MVVRIRLIKKLAEVIDGVDVSAFDVGDCIEIDVKDARILLAEGWAEIVNPHPRDPEKPDM